MAHIIAGHIQQQDQVAHLLDALRDAQFDEGKITSFYLNPPGQHDLYPTGGDRDQSPGAKETGTGLAYGMAGGGFVGAAIGLAGTPVMGPLAPALGAAVGAHLGSLMGVVSELKEKGEDEAGGENAREQRHAGMMVAVSVADPAQEKTALDVLRSFGAKEIERSEGEIIDGDWRDFDPLDIPDLIDRPRSTQ